MLWWMVLGAALAGELEVSLATPVMVLVDGQATDIDTTLTARARSLSAGSHRVVVRNMVGKLVVDQAVDVGADELVRLRYAAKALTEVSRSVVAPAPPAPQSPAAPAAAPVATQAAVAAPGASAGVSATSTPTLAVVQGGIAVDGQAVATMGATATETGATVGVDMVDPVTGERVSIGLSVNTTGMGITLAGTPAAAPPPPPEPIGEPDLAALLRALADASFSSDREAILRTAATHHHFRVAQVVRLIEPIPMSGDKLAAVQALAPKVVDPGNAHLLGAAFSFSADREAAQALFR